jgi:KTSC domain-containing protein
VADPTFSPTTRVSSNVKEVGQCADGHLYVRFHTGGLYRWDGLAAQHHDALRDDYSPGRYVGKMLPKGTRVE